MAGDGMTSRWSHSTGESAEFHQRIQAAGARSASSDSGSPEGTIASVREATVGISGNATDMAMAIVRGQEAQIRRSRPLEETGAESSGESSLDKNTKEKNKTRDVETQTQDPPVPPKDTPPKSTATKEALAKEKGSRRKKVKEAARKCSLQ
jgi:hypothetical protein